MAVRNYFFDKGWLTSTSFSLPVIAVGNLSMGGTGKSPQIEYLIRLLQERYALATLSRGYGRKTKGYVLATAQTKMSDLGDEPFQFHSKFPEITVAVDENRVEGITNLLQLDKSPEVILLDDAYQHRKVKADYYILLTAYDELFVNDWVVPVGNLRETRKGAQRSDVVVVTKCPVDISQKEMNAITTRINKYTDSPVFYSTVAYDEKLYSSDTSILLNDLAKESCLIVAGIAKPHPFVDYIKQGNDGHEVLLFPDHHNFSESDIEAILARAKGRKIITTEKDYMRLQNRLPAEQLYYQSIKTEFLERQEDLDQLILEAIQNKKATS